MTVQFIAKALNTSIKTFESALGSLAAEKRLKHNGRENRHQSIPLY